MSGHNKWSKIKRQKEKTDAQKSKIFGKMVRERCGLLKRFEDPFDDPLRLRYD
jgi:transcriptional/translational regulatory protein YebC/TACO1